MIICTTQAKNNEKSVRNNIKQQNSDNDILKCIPRPINWVANIYTYCAVGGIEIASRQIQSENEPPPHELK